MEEDPVAIGIFIMGGILSYELPIYVARYLGREWELNQGWTRAFNDSLGSGILYLAAWMAAGCAMWLLPLILIGRFWRTLLMVLLWPLMPFYLAVKRAVSGIAEKREEQAYLHDLWRTEFRGRFKTFRAFMKFVDSGGTIDAEQPRIEQEQPRPEPPKPSASSSYQEALSMLGLTEGCNRQDLNSRYRTLAKQVHPDIVGPNDIFRRLTEARDTIAGWRGWPI